MSIAFSPVLPEGFSWYRAETYDDYDWCLCAQMAPDPCSLIHTEEGREVLRQHAFAGCAICQGTGISRVDADFYGPSFNLSQDNARIVCGELLGLAECWGAMPIARMRMHLQKARSALVRRGETLVRSEYQEMVLRKQELVVGGDPIDAVVARVFSCALDVEGMEERLSRMEAFLVEAESFGCEGVSWG